MNKVILDIVSGLMSYADNEDKIRYSYCIYILKNNEQDLVEIVLVFTDKRLWKTHHIKESFTGGDVTRLIDMNGFVCAFIGRVIGQWENFISRGDYEY